jgi:N-acetylmuramoyl-L-alanine amidase
MPTTHVVEQGEHLSGIAEHHGFSGYKVIWDDPQNAQLKKLRENPNVLFPGDELFIPDKGLKYESRPTGARHRFVAPGEHLKLRLILNNASAEAATSVPCVLNVEADSQEKPTDSKGQLEMKIARSARAGRLRASNDKMPFELDVPVSIGELDPVTEVTGQIARLNNLGYDAGPVQEPADDAAREQLRSAIEEFQCDFMGQNDLATIKQVVDGICGKLTQAKLKQVYGC